MKSFIDSIYVYKIYSAPEKIVTTLWWQCLQNIGNIIEWSWTVSMSIYEFIWIICKFIDTIVDSNDFEAHRKKRQRMREKMK